MARQCHLNTCPVGIATQREDLRRKFKGTPEQVIRFFMAVAEDVREILATIGARSLAEIVGRSDLLEARLPVSGKASTIKLDRVLRPAMAGGCVQPRNDPPVSRAAIDDAVLAGVRFREPIPLRNSDRSIGARLAGAIASGRMRKKVNLSFNGTAGQSFGAFCVDGMRFVLDGDANDGVAKGMSGGEIVIRNRNTRHVIAGNAVLYGATGGRLFISGRAGERFAIRNSGAFAVVEGTGDHACEYMTAGAVIILGPTGINVAAGMTGGALFVYDEAADLDQHINPASAVLSNVAGEEWLYEAIALHVEATQSEHAAWLLRNWNETRAMFRCVSPREISAAAALPELQVAREASTSLRRRA
ncbi:MAG TPA: glutamate synthase-related protein, partial [Thermoanaerobaculia bacterium]